MAEVDILSGMPKSLLRQQAQSQQHEKAMSEAQSMAGAIRSEQGQEILKLIEKKLADRVDFLIKNDAEARTCVNILEQMGTIVAQGIVAAKKKIKENIGGVEPA